MNNEELNEKIIAFLTSLEPFRESNDNVALFMGWISAGGVLLKRPDILTATVLALESVVTKTAMMVLFGALQEDSTEKSDIKDVIEEAKRVLRDGEE